MSYKVILDDDVFEALQSEATPLVDDVNSVLRRKLGLNKPDSEAPRPRARQREALPDEEFELPLLQALMDLGGAGPTKLVIDRVGVLLANRLTEADRAPLPSSKEPRWRNRTQFARLSLVKTGHMVKGSPRGYWEITDSGRRRAESDRQRD